MKTVRLVATQSARPFAARHFASCRFSQALQFMPVPAAVRCGAKPTTSKLRSLLQSLTPSAPNGLEAAPRPTGSSNRAFGPGTRIRERGRAMLTAFVVVVFVVVVVVAVAVSTPAQLRPSGTQFCGGVALMPWTETCSGTLLRHMSAYQTRSLSVGRTMQLAMLMLALALQARLSSSSRQAPKLWTSATLTSNACDTVGWRTPSPNKGCAEPTSAPAPGCHDERAAIMAPTVKPISALPFMPAQERSGRKLRRKRMSACAQELVLHSLQLSQNKYDSRPRPELPVAQPSPKQQLDLHAMD